MRHNDEIQCTRNEAVCMNMGLKQTFSLYSSINSLVANILQYKIKYVTLNNNRKKFFFKSLTYVLHHVLLVQIIERFSLSDLAEKGEHLVPQETYSPMFHRFVNALYFFREGIFEE